MITTGTGITINRSEAENAAPHPVLVLPGFTKDDRFMDGFKARLTDNLGPGYVVEGWNGPTVTGGNTTILDHARTRLHDIFAQNNGQKITLVGHSFGGILARELAREFPTMVEQVVTAGTPVREFQIAAAAPLYMFLQGVDWLEQQTKLARQIRMPSSMFDTATIMNNWTLMQRSAAVTLNTGLHDADIMARIEHPIQGVVVHAFYSEHDKLVPARMARIREDGCHRNHVVTTSNQPGLVEDHYELIGNPANITAIAGVIKLRGTFAACISGVCLAPVACPRAARGMTKTLFAGGRPHTPAALPEAA